MNILYLCDEYPPGRHGGIGTAVQTLAREMVRQGHTVVVAGFYDWGYGGEDEFEDEGVKVYRFRRKLSAKFLGDLRSLPVRIVYKLLTVSGLFEWDIKTSLKKYEHFLRGLVQKYHIDIAEVPDYIDYLRFCKSYLPFPVLPVPVVVRLHGSLTYFAKEAGNEVPEYIYRTDKALLEQATAVCSVSKYTAARTVEYFNYSQQIQVIYNGIEIGKYALAKHKIKNKVVFSGTLIEKKGIYQLVKAWNRVVSVIPLAELYIYGKGPIKKIQSLLESHAIEKVKFMGHVSRQELLQSLAEANLAVFPSFAETFGLAAIEAMVCSTAVVFTTKTSGPEIIDDKVNGLLANPEDVNELANAIIYLLQNVDICNLYAERGRKKVEEEFNISTCARKMASYYNIYIKHK